MSSNPFLYGKVKRFLFLLSVRELFNGFSFSVSRQHDMLMYINMTVISVMARNLKSVVDILLGLQVSVVLFSA